MRENVQSRAQLFTADREIIGPNDPQRVRISGDAAFVEYVLSLIHDHADACSYDIITTFAIKGHSMPALTTLPGVDP